MRVTKKLAAVMIALVTVIAVAGTSIPVEAAAKAPKKITLKTTAKTVDIKGKATISVKSVSPKGADKGVKYQSSNKKVATVSSKGVVTGKKAGKTTITVTSKKNKKVKKKITIKVKQLKPTSISLTSAASLKAGGKQALKATVKPAGVYCPVAWSSSDASVASVDSKGNVQAKKAGTAVITVKAKEKNKSGKYISKTCTVTVAADAATVDRDRADDAIDWQYVTSEKLLANKDDYIIIDLRPNIINGSDGKDNGRGYQYGHIEGSVHVPAWPVDTKERENLVRSSYVLEQIKSSDKKIAFVCQSGANGAKRAISVLKDEGITLSRMYIQKGGGIDLLKNHSDQLVKGTGEAFSGNLVLSAAEAKAKIAAGAILVDTRGIKASDETAKGAITMSWPMISNMAGAGKAGHARSLSAAEMNTKLGALGLGINDDIVLFSAGHATGGWGDDGRVAWQLIQCGYTNVHIVNGGLAAMKAEGVATQTGPAAPKAKTANVTNVDTKSHDITTEELLANFDQYKIIDVRANAEYDGAVLYDEASGGHIKGALHIRFSDLFRYDGTLKSNAELTKMFEAKGLAKSDKIVTYCTGGIRSAYMQLVLQMLGYENSYNYAESAYRWSNTKDAGTADCWEGPATDIAFAKSEITTSADGYKLTSKGAIAEANPLTASSIVKITYASANESVAKVDATGTVTTTGYGEATITAKADNGKQASYKIIVTDRSKDAIDWDSRAKSSEDVINEAAAGTLVVLDTRLESIPMDAGSAIPDVGYAAGHIKGSIWVPSWPVDEKAKEDSLRAKAADLKATGKPIAIICRSGAGGAKRAISVLKEEGIDESKLFIQTGGGTDLIKNHLDKLEVGTGVSAQAATVEEEKDITVTSQGEASEAADEASDTDKASEDENADVQEDEVSGDSTGVDETAEEGYNGEQTPDAEPSAE